MKLKKKSIADTKVPGTIMLFIGPSGVGKNSIIEELLAKHFPNGKKSISVTTRTKYDGEVEGVDYYFVTRREFLRRVEVGEFLEHAEVHKKDCFYGTPKAPVLQMLQEGVEVFMDLDTKGADQIIACAEKFGWNVYVVFLVPPTIESLQERISVRKRGESDEEVEARLARAVKELDEAKKYGLSHIFVNHTDGKTKCAEAIVRRHKTWSRPRH